jgi:hypothetical protein
MLENACSGTVGDVIDSGWRRGRESLIDVVTVVHWSKPSSRPIHSRLPVGRRSPLPNAPDTYDASQLPRRTGARAAEPVSPCDGDSDPAP